MPPVWQVAWWCVLSGLTGAAITWIYTARPPTEPEPPHDPQHPDLIENPERRTR